MRLAVKEVDESVVGAAEDLVAVVAEAHREDAEAAVVGAQRQRVVPLLVAEHVHLVDCRGGEFVYSDVQLNMVKGCKNYNHVPRYL